MRKFVIISILVFVTLLAGCEVLDGLMMASDPNSMAPMEQVGAIAQKGGAVAATVGFPWGIVVSSVGSAVGGICAVYTNMRKKQKATEDKSKDIEAALSAVIEAVEASKDVVVKEDGTKVDQIIKKLVKEKLEEKHIYVIGKAIISAIKNSEVK